MEPAGKMAFRLIMGILNQGPGFKSGQVDLWNALAGISHKPGALANKVSLIRRSFRLAWASPQFAQSEFGFETASVQGAKGLILLRAEKSCISLWERGGRALPGRERLNGREQQTIDQFPVAI